MASRLARSAAGAAKLRPSILPRSSLPALPLTSARYQSNVPAEEPKKKAQSIVDALPGNSLVSKTAILSAGAGISTWAISNELYVLNEETVVAFCLLSVFYGIFKYGGPMYNEWAENTTTRIKGILDEARKGHADAVRTRIEDVKPLGNVVEITKSLFEVSKETAKLEAQAFELEQRTALASEAKNVLDSWVRYESQVKQRQQRELAESVIAKINKELENPKVLQQILQQSIADIERVVQQKPGQ
ncbi:uncharacterized protein HMPREF1541_02708 [Cyphellophora europaea CBS 101466]|uniref:ATP synthase subunit 4 n=1 Tax=Cyphellophora europaea (strain CBS 101466) TaxID=1220924 RepID=W2S6J5_CYPE1|nr:uncharacterized protein HMPREF1541_02708 [Cyphellophora europaea CBS 101466]ETN43549.1 hypothetical protein HMPREF1541_02708 [Cyphellophora europaea CBS 101466]